MKLLCHSVPVPVFGPFVRGDVTKVDRISGRGDRKYGLLDEALPTRYATYKYVIRPQSWT